MNKRLHRIRRLARAILASAFAFQFGGCTTADVQAQFANGLSTALTGIFKIGAQSLANQLFGVDD